MKKNQVVRKLGSLVLTFANESAPTEPEWDEFLSVITTHRPELPKLKFLVVTKGGSPNAAQRKRLEVALGRTRFPVAVVSDAITVRFVASTIALFHRDHRSFSMDQMSLAYDHLQMSPAERTMAEKVISDMRLLVG
ncbi:MAG: hypothetical protein ABSC94_22755 [Polyangiaceae bacterium]|jgi:hypothetical protein